MPVLGMMIFDRVPGSEHAKPGLNTAVPRAEWCANCRKWIGAKLWERMVPCFSTYLSIRNHDRAAASALAQVA